MAAGAVKQPSSGLSSLARVPSSPALSPTVRGSPADDALIARFCTGDRAAAKEIVAAELPGLLSLCANLLVSRTEAEDAAQETMLRLWRHAHEWRPDRARLRTWLRRVAINVCFDRLRLRKRETPDELPVMIDARPQAHERLAQKQEAARLRAAIGRLPRRQRVAVALRYFEDLSNEDAAQTMQISVQALESLLARAKRGLRDALTREERNARRRGRNRP